MNKSCHTRPWASIPNDRSHSGHQVHVIRSSNGMPVFVIARFHVIRIILIFEIFWNKSCHSNPFKWYLHLTGVLPVQKIVE